MVYLDTNMCVIVKLVLYTAIYTVSQHKCVSVYRMTTATFVLWSVMPVAYVSAGYPWTVWTPASEDAVRATMEWELWRSSHDNWDCLSWGFLKYFFAVSFIHTTSCQVHTCCQIVIIVTNFMTNNDLARFDHLISCVSWWWCLYKKLNTSEHMFWDISDIFLTISLCRASAFNLFSLCVCVCVHILHTHTHHDGAYSDAILYHGMRWS